MKQQKIIMQEITVQGKTPVPFSKQEINNIMRKILHLIKVKKYSIGIAFVSEAKITVYNKAYRKKDKPTDVLSFLYPSAVSKAFLEGDIIICPAYVKKDIKKSGADFAKQIKRLLAHGTLHLLGMDHATSSEADVMFARQEQILTQL